MELQRSRRETQSTRKEIEDTSSLRMDPEDVDFQDPRVSGIFSRNACTTDEVTFAVIHSVEVALPRALIGHWVHATRIAISPGCLGCLSVLSFGEAAQLHICVCTAMKKIFCLQRIP